MDVMWSQYRNSDMVYHASSRKNVPNTNVYHRRRHSLEGGSITESSDLDGGLYPCDTREGVRRASTGKSLVDLDVLHDIYWHELNITEVSALIITEHI